MPARGVYQEKMTGPSFSLGQLQLGSFAFETRQGELSNRVTLDSQLEIVLQRSMIAQYIFQFKQLERRSLKNQGFNRIRTRDLRDTGAMLYKLSYEDLPVQ